MASLGEKIRDSFKRIQQEVSDAVVMTMLIDICTSCGISSDNLANLWDAFLVNNSSVKNPVAPAVEKFRTEVKAKFQVRTPVKPEKPARDSVSTPPLAEGVGAALFSRYGMVAPTPTSSVKTERKRPSPLSAASSDLLPSSSASVSASTTPVSVRRSEKYARRRNVGELKCAFNGRLEEETRVEIASSSVKKSVSVTTVETTAPYRYMWDALEKRAEAWKERSARLGNTLLSRHETELGEGEMGTFHLPKAEEVLCSGKICSDAADEKWDIKSVVLEGQAPDSDNLYRVKLDLKSCPSYSLFPGQTVALKGVNPVGNAFVVKKMVSDASLPLAMTDESLVYEQGTVKITMAAGPFCPHDSNDYQALSDLMDVVLKKGTDVLILMGPFVEATHPDIEHGTIDYTYEDLFKYAINTHVLSRIDAYNSTAARGKIIQKVVLIPSVQDMHHHPVFPQFPFSQEGLAPASRDLLVMASNPCQLRINGVVFGFTTTDPMKHIASCLQLHRPAEEQAPLSRIMEIASHIIEQQSFMPLEPPPLDINLDATHLSAVEFGEETPQVLVLPSALKEFADPLKGVLVINPSFLIRGGTGGGTFAEVVLYPKQEDLGLQPMDTEADGRGTMASAAAAAAVEYDVMKRVGVKIVKI